VAEVLLEDLSAEIERRIKARMDRFAPDDPRLREALLRIGFLVEAEAKMNVRRRGIIDTGRLLNSIRSEFFRRKDKAGIMIGSFGVPYAAMHEFGGPFTDKQRRAMFASMRERGKLGPVRKPGKGIIRGNVFTARPYLRPAVIRHAPRIIDIIRNLFR
jgi:phage gpG-like protein